ncbi:DciA family protein [Avibacterium avium]|uniref:DciA family protein n=1 Tax=Avibacterium avium TaxID=751 RepID=UPI003BF7FA2E
MRYSKPTNVQDVLENSSLGKIMQKGILLQQLNEQVERLFPNQFKGFYRVANLSETTLVIEVANAMVRQSLLFKEKDLLAKVQDLNPQIQQLQFKVNPALISQPR